MIARVLTCGIVRADMSDRVPDADEIATVANKQKAAVHYADALAALKEQDFGRAEVSLGKSVELHRTDKAVNVLRRIREQTAVAKDRDVPDWVYTWRALPVCLGLLGCTSLSGSRSLHVMASVACITCLLLTVLTAYVLWFPIREPGVYFPAISALGVAHPQRLVYQYGFAVVGITLAIHIHTFREVLVSPHLLFDNDIRRKKMADDCIWYGYLAAAGAGLQGLFTLEMKTSPQSFIHWGSAMMFMMGSMHHSQMSSVLYAEATSQGRLLQNEWVATAANFREALLKYSSVIMFAPMILSQVFFASKNNDKNENKDISTASPAMMNAMGLMQWSIILQFSIYFLSYAMDIWIASNHIELE